MKQDDKAKVAETSTSIANNTSTEVSNYFDVDNLKRIEGLVDALKDSTYAEIFTEKKYDKHEDGSPDLSTEKKVFNRADMVLCLGLGASFGMNPFVALSYGKSLNLTAVKKLERGRKLGLDYSTSLDQIYVWGTGQKEIVYTSIHIVNACLTRAGITKRVIQNGTVPMYYCREVESGIETIFDSSKHKDTPQGLPKTTLDGIIKAVKEANLVPVYRDNRPTFIGEVELTRINPTSREKEVISIPYNTKQAIEAELLQGIKVDGSESKGKDNWNKHIATHLLKMSVMLGGRMIASDALNGIYVPEEISFLKDIKDNDKFEEAEIVDSN